MVPVVQVQGGPQSVCPTNVLHQAQVDDQELLYPQLTVVPGHGVLQHSGGEGDRDLTHEVSLYLDLYLSLTEHGQTELIAHLNPTPA